MLAENPPLGGIGMGYTLDELTESVALGSQPERCAFW